METVGNQDQDQGKELEQPRQEQAPPLLALPGTSSAAAAAAGDGVDEGGQAQTPTTPTTTSTTVKLDALGPLVVNSDGTLSRIANWADMTDAERERTVQVLGRRNRIRIGRE